ncbi:hypothetical protein E2C01_027536 [Portunus trituberculatus]|uniref:Uncharacterized protein n=1 Tax=Portunus trituberculatus TaxID=210409 RepID=A0A5B7ELS9_PORTR|nr:hypothetical protein [Portunus trituberculatus]
MCVSPKYSCRRHKRQHGINLISAYFVTSCVARADRCSCYLCIPSTTTTNATCGFPSFSSGAPRGWLKIVFVFSSNAISLSNYYLLSVSLSIIHVCRPPILAQPRPGGPRASVQTHAI